jgi:hypothetical protein
VVTTQSKRIFHIQLSIFKNFRNISGVLKEYQGFLHRFVSLALLTHLARICLNVQVRFLLVHLKTYRARSSQQRIGLRDLRDVLIWLYRISFFSLLMDLFAGAELEPVYSLTF